MLTLSLLIATQTAAAATTPSTHGYCSSYLSTGSYRACICAKDSSQWDDPGDYVSSGDYSTTEVDSDGDGVLDTTVFHADIYATTGDCYQATDLTSGAGASGALKNLETTGRAVLKDYYDATSERWDWTISGTVGSDGLMTADASTTEFHSTLVIANTPHPGVFDIFNLDTGMVEGTISMDGTGGDIPVDVYGADWDMDGMLDFQIVTAQGEIWEMHGNQLFPGDIIGKPM